MHSGHRCDTPAAASGRRQALYSTAAEFRFSTTSNGAPCLGDGWGPVERDHVWSVAAEAELRIPVAQGEGDLMVQLLGTPFVAPPRFATQRMTVRINDIDFGTEILRSEFGAGFHLAAPVGPELRIRLGFPDAIRPIDAKWGEDTRPLGIALSEVLAVRVPQEAPRPSPRRILPPLPISQADFGPRTAEVVRGFTALSIQDLLLQFESLGHNCEFGMLQRQLGAEPMGLLRLAGIRPHALLRGLDLGFPGAEDCDLLQVYTSEPTGKEYMLHNTRWGMDSHTHRFEGQITPEALKREQTRKLGFYRRKLLEVLETGERLFVFQYYRDLSEALVLPLLTTLRSYGPNALLAVRRTSDEPAGAVEKLRPDLYMGAIDRFAPGDQATNVNLTAWISICANAYRLWREEGGGA